MCRCSRSSRPKLVPRFSQLAHSTAAAQHGCSGTGLTAQRCTMQQAAQSTVRAAAAERHAYQTSRHAASHTELVHSLPSL